MKDWAAQRDLCKSQLHLALTVQFGSNYLTYCIFCKNYLHLLRALSLFGTVKPLHSLSCLILKQLDERVADCWCTAQTSLPVTFRARWSDRPLSALAFLCLRTSSGHHSPFGRQARSARNQCSPKATFSHWLMGVSVWIPQLPYLLDEITLSCTRYTGSQASLVGLGSSSQSGSFKKIEIKFT